MSGDAAGASDDEPERRADEVERALEQPRGAREPEAPDAEQRHALDVVELDRRADDLEHARQHADAHAQAPWRRGRGRGLAPGRRRPGR